MNIFYVLREAEKRLLTQTHMFGEEVGVRRSRKDSRRGDF